jgi:hypothetical protein
VATRSSASAARQNGAEASPSGFRLRPKYRPAAAEVRSRLTPPERFLFDLLCLAGHLGLALPPGWAALRRVTGRHDPRRRLRRYLAEHDAPTADWARVSARLTGRLVRTLRAREADEPYRLLRVVLGNASVALAADCTPPTDPILAAAWTTVIRLFPRLYSAQLGVLGKLSWLDESALRGLRKELGAGLRRGRLASGLRPGPKGRELAIDPRLMRLASRALGRRVKPAFVARYLFYTRAGDHFWPHPDDPEYPVNLLVCLDRQLPRDATRGSASLAFYPDGRVERYELAPGEALAVEARGLIHGREPLLPGERVVLLSIAAA